MSDHSAEKFMLEEKLINEMEMPEEKTVAMKTDQPLYIPEKTMTSQLVAIWIATGQETYKKEYLRRLKMCGLSSDAANKMLKFEEDILRRFFRPEMLDNDFIKRPLMNLREPCLKKGVDYYSKNFELPLSYVVKLSDEAEWHFWNSHEKDLPDDVWGEIYAMADRNQQLFVPYAMNLVDNVGWTIEEVNVFSYNEQGMLDLQRWGIIPGQAAKDPWNIKAGQIRFDIDIPKPAAQEKKAAAPNTADSEIDSRIKLISQAINEKKSLTATEVTGTAGPGIKVPPGQNTAGNMGGGNMPAASKAGTSAKKILLLGIALILILVIGFSYARSASRKAEAEKPRNVATDEIKEGYTNVYGDVIYIEPHYKIDTYEGYAKTPQNKRGYSRIICRCLTTEGEVFWLAVPGDDYINKILTLAPQQENQEEEQVSGYQIDALEELQERIRESMQQDLSNRGNPDAYVDYHEVLFDAPVRITGHVVKLDESINNFPDELRDQLVVSEDSVAGE